MTDIVQLLDREIADRHLLNHQFYQRWTAGELTRGELEEYGRQYFHYALAFPTFLSAIHAQSDDLLVRQYLLENLIEEERGPENHPELWLRFCEALGLDRSAVAAGQANEATQALIACVRRFAGSGEAQQGLAALYAYESQVPAVAAAKIKGLAEWYGISAPRDIAFFSVHTTADVAHAATSAELLAEMCDTPERAESARAAAAETLQALYAFLDSVTVN